jgi:hypothetical protein
VSKSCFLSSKLRTTEKIEAIVAEDYDHEGVYLLHANLKVRRRCPCSLANATRRPPHHMSRCPIVVLHRLLLSTALELTGPAWPPRPAARPGTESAVSAEPRLPKHPHQHPREDRGAGPPRRRRGGGARRGQGQRQPHTLCPHADYTYTQAHARARTHTHTHTHTRHAAAPHLLVNSRYNPPPRPPRRWLWRTSCWAAPASTRRWW